MTDPSGDLPPCAECAGRIELFGRLKQRFLHPNLRDLICTECAQRMMPESYAMAQSLEHGAGPYDPDR